MEATQMSKEERIVIEADDGPAVYVEGVVPTEYGEKLALGGDTYEVLSSNGEGLADDLDFSEHHCAFDWDHEKWTIDLGSEGALAEVLEENGHRLGGLGPEVIDAAEELKDDSADHKYWASHGITVRVEYETPDGNELSKEGTFSSADRDRGYAQLKTDDHKVYRVEGGAILAPKSSYPFMGKIERVVVRA